MTEIDSAKEASSSPDPHLKEQDEGIIEAFAKEDHQVLTNTEISEHVSVSDRTVRRRLDDLDEKGVIGKRVVSGVKLAWLEKEVKEPITVQYPLLRYVRDRISVQLFLIGLAIGIISILISMTAALTIGYNIPLGFVSNEQLLLYGVLAGSASASFMLVSIGAAAFEKSLRYFGINIEERIEVWREQS